MDTYERSSVASGHRGRDPWTLDAIHALGATTDVQTAGAILGIGRSKAYELVRAGEFPVQVLRIGRRIFVPTAAIVSLLDPHP
jgi:hypothetical protein